MKKNSFNFVLLLLSIKRRHFGEHGAKTKYVIQLERMQLQ